ncbi:ATP-binding protein [Roseibium denhamense]|uniref:Predicted kinase n=1 Tax=Roseibium denhamense TaxID=76305 RepID=A0ABY1PFR1_9HYPH|nr:ATP-binding protein [Roseibium denhamense]MTI05005.1 ATP-binding protein [Roseibium denhamense]SMP33198.1 Predicted kinase [Roseibium denhamense]
MTHAHLHLIAGKIASGKSTKALELSAAPGSVLISEDAWLATLFGPEMTSVKDFVRVSARLRAAMAPHIVSLLRSGVTVVLDFHANTPESRAWMREMIEAAGCAHTLYYLKVPDDICKSRMRARNATGHHPFEVSDKQFEAVNRHFVPPAPSEGFHVRTYRATE